MFTKEVGEVRPVVVMVILEPNFRAVLRVPGRSGRGSRAGGAHPAGHDRMPPDRRSDRAGGEEKTDRRGLLWVFQQRKNYADRAIDPGVGITG